MSRAVMQKLAGYDGRIIGGLLGAGAGGLGGYELGKLISADKSARLLTALATGGVGALLGYKAGEGIDTYKDPSGVKDVPWSVAHKKELWEALGGLGGAGLGLAGSYAFGNGDKPAVNLLSALMMGGLGAVGGGLAYDALDTDKNGGSYTARTLKSMRDKGMTYTDAGFEATRKQLIEDDEKGTPLEQAQKLLTDAAASTVGVGINHPWETGAAAVGVGANSWRLHAQNVKLTNQILQSMSEADRAVIAASPELSEALREVVGKYSTKFVGANSKVLTRLAEDAAKAGTTGAKHAYNLAHSTASIRRSSPWLIKLLRNINILRLIK